MQQYCRQYWIGLSTDKESPQSHLCPYSTAAAAMKTPQDQQFLSVLSLVASGMYVCPKFTERSWSFVGICCPLVTPYMDSFVLKVLFTDNEEWDWFFTADLSAQRRHGKALAPKDAVRSARQSEETVRRTRGLFPACVTQKRCKPQRSERRGNYQET